MGCPQEHTDNLELPRFPSTAPLCFTHGDFLNASFEDNPTLISEYSFAGLMLFADYYGYALSCADYSFVIAGMDPPRTQDVNEPAGGETTGRTNPQPFVLISRAFPPDEMLAQFLQHGFVIKAIPHTRAQQAAYALQKIASTARGVLTCDEGDFDYLHKRANLVELPGRKFHKKRNHVNYFVDHYNYKTVPLTRQTIPAARDVVRQWRARHGSDGDYNSTMLALDNYEKLSFVGEVTFVSNKPAGFVIGELRNAQQWCVIHFEKANTEYKGLFQYINQHFAQSLPTTCRVLNREQDLGEDGLRQAKRTYRPDVLLKKYRIYPQGVVMPSTSTVVYTP